MKLDGDIKAHCAYSLFKEWLCIWRCEQEFELEVHILPGKLKYPRCVLALPISSMIILSLMQASVDFAECISW